ncbi:MAG: hypothetical protein GY853_16755 [PVC group bacterium]|nr:hypothetical protein [PVC group bacterium]
MSNPSESFGGYRLGKPSGKGNTRKWYSKGRKGAADTKRVIKAIGPLVKGLIEQDAKTKRLNKRLEALNKIATKLATTFMSIERSSKGVIKTSDQMSNQFKKQSSIKKSHGLDLSPIPLPKTAPDIPSSVTRIMDEMVAMQTRYAKEPLNILAPSTPSSIATPFEYPDLPPPTIDTPEVDDMGPELPSTLSNLTGGMPEGMIGVLQEIMQGGMGAAVSFGGGGPDGGPDEPVGSTYPTLAEIMAGPTSPVGIGGPLGLAPEDDNMGQAHSAFSSFGDRVKELFGKNSSVGKGMKDMGKGAGMAFGMFGMLLDKLGVMEPILDIIGIIFEVIGGALMQALLPALQVLFDVISSPEFLEVLMQIGEVLGAILVPIIMIFASLLEAVAPLLLIVAKVFAAVLVPIVEAFAPVFESLGPLFKEIVAFIKPLIPVIKIVAWVIGKVLAFAFIIIANIIIMIVNIILMIINAVAWLFGMAPISLFTPLALPALAEGGIVTRPTVAMIGEAGPEAVVPLDKAGGGMGDNEFYFIEMNDKLGSLVHIQNKQTRRLQKRRLG